MHKSDNKNRKNDRAKTRRRRKKILAENEEDARTKGEEEREAARFLS